MTQRRNNLTFCKRAKHIAYVLTISLIQIGLFVIGIRRYLDFKAKAFDAKYGGNWSYKALDFTLACLITAIACFLIFIYTSFTHTSNFAEKRVKIGRDTDFLSLVYSFIEGSPSIDVSTENHQTSRSFNNNSMWTDKKVESECHNETASLFRLLWKRFKQNFLPTSGFMHVIVAFSLLMPICVQEGQEISHRALPDEHTFGKRKPNFQSILFAAIWFTKKSLLIEMVFMCALSFIFDNNASVFISLNKQSSVEIEQPEQRNNSRYNLDGVLIRFFKICNIEFCNLILALVIICYQYPAVFWYTNKKFSCIFWALLSICCGYILLETCVAEILVKLTWNPQLWPTNFEMSCFAPFETVNSVHFAERDPIFDSILDQGNIYFIIISVLSNIFLLTNFVIVYEYGYRLIGKNLVGFRNYIATSEGPQDSGLDGNSEHVQSIANENVSVINSEVVSSGTLGETRKLNIKHLNSRASEYSKNVFHHKNPNDAPKGCCLSIKMIHVAAFFSFTLGIASKIPLIWNAINLYKSTENPIILSFFVSCGLFAFLWIIVWFAFLLKPACKFRINFPIPSDSTYPKEKLYVPINFRDINTQAPINLIPTTCSPNELYKQQYSVPSAQNLCPNPLYTLPRQTSFSGGLSTNYLQSLESNSLLGPRQHLTLHSQYPENNLDVSITSGTLPHIRGDRNRTSSPIYAYFNRQQSGPGVIETQEQNRSALLGRCFTSLNPQQSTLSQLSYPGGLVYRSADCCSEDTEHSGRSGNNYVYLQTAQEPVFNTTNVPAIIPVAMPANPIIVQNSSGSACSQASSNTTVALATNIHGRLSPAPQFVHTSWGPSSKIANLKMSQSSDFHDANKTLINGFPPKDLSTFGSPGNLQEDDGTLLPLMDPNAMLGDTLSTGRELSEEVICKRDNYVPVSRSVTFKGTNITAVDCSPNSSEPGSHNTASSDSGIDGQQRLPESNASNKNGSKELRIMSKSCTSPYDNTGPGYDGQGTSEVANSSIVAAMPALRITSMGGRYDAWKNQDSAFKQTNPFPTLKTFLIASDQTAYASLSRHQSNTSTGSNPSNDFSHDFNSTMSKSKSRESRLCSQV